MVGRAARCSISSWATLALKYGARNAIIGMAVGGLLWHRQRHHQPLRDPHRPVGGAVRASCSERPARATTLIFATAIYYAVFEGAVIAVAAHHLYPAVPYWLVALAVVIYSVLLIFGSVQRWLDKFNGVLLPFYLLACCWPW